jgi:DNA-binding CsgD family transcriptional regulator
MTMRQDAPGDVQALSEREKETLRLLLAGHDAKSAARMLGLSIHTINERLRDARRKLGAASSREAARRLAEAEGTTPDFVGDKHLGVAAAAASPPRNGPSERRWNEGTPLLWLSGGMLIMSLIIAAAMLALTAHGTGAPQSAPALSTATAPAAATTTASTWVQLLDGQRWSDSWDTAGSLFKNQMKRDRWAATIQPLRQPLGAPAARATQSATRTATLPGMPAGDYAVVQYRTNFATKPGTIETVVLVREGANWTVNGYFIR